MLPEIIIHGGIEHISLEPMSGTFPNLANQQSLRVCCLHRFPEGTPEAVIHLAGHIQPPAVNMELLYPVSAYPAQIILYFLISSIELGHHPLIGKASIGGILLRTFRPYHRKFQVVEPVPIGGKLLVLHHICKGKEVPAAMIEYPIDEDTDSVGMKNVHQLPKDLVPAKHRVHMEIVHQIVLVVLPGSKNRIEVDTVDPQSLEIIHIISNPFQGSAQPAPKGVAFIFYLLGFLGNIPVAGGEAVGKNVIHHRILHPLRHSGNVRPVIEGQLEILRPVIYQFLGKHIAVI